LKVVVFSTFVLWPLLRPFGYEILGSAVAAFFVAWLAFSVIRNGTKLTGEYLFLPVFMVALFVTFIVTLVFLLWGIIILVKFVSVAALYVWQHFGYAIAFLFVAWLTFNVIRNGVNIAVERVLNIAVLVCVVAVIASFSGAIVLIGMLAWEPAAYIYAHIWPGAESYVAKVDLVQISFFALVLFVVGRLCLFLLVWLDTDARERLIQRRRAERRDPRSTTEPDPILDG
jgi:hypothetical protein